jgi:ABC-type multidrug transport system ATPase subunit
MNVWDYNLDPNMTTGTWSSSRSNTNCNSASQKSRLISDNAYGGFALMVRNCSKQQAATRILYTLSNLTGLGFECASMQSRHLPSHKAVDDVVFAGYFSPRVGEQAAKVAGVTAAFDFKDVSKQRLHVTVMHNTSQAAYPFGKRGAEVFVHTRKDRILAPLNDLLRSYFSQILGDESGLLTGLKAFPMTPPWGQAPDLGSIFGPFLITITFLVLLPSIVVTHVQEKVSRNRIMMKMQGLGTSAYWSISYIFWFSIMFSFSMVFFLLANVISTDSGYKIGMFQRVAPSVQFVFFLLFSMNVVSFCFLLSTLASSLRVAQVGTSFFIIVSVVLGSVFEGVGDIWNSDGVSRSAKTFITLFPSMGFYRGMVAFRSHDADDIMNWHHLEVGEPMGDVLLILGLESVVFLVLALYLDQVSNQSGYGVAAHPLFCVGYGKERHVKGRHDQPSNYARAQQLQLPEEGPPGKSIEQDEDVSVMARLLQKVYPDGKEAVKPLTLGVKCNECFGMLGPNGAGKTTTINMLTGFTTPSSGDALIEAKFNILNHMPQIYSIMGVCPQHDILWETLSPREHLTFYGNLKNLNGEKLKYEIECALRSVNLLDEVDVPVGTFSGGMKRRLSVAIAFIGMPLVCYLDEPSTGLDPANRRLLWDSIKRAKASRTIILTTHSMEEAEGLCDRLSIFVNGEMKCMGTPASLIMQYNAVYNVVVTTDNAAEQTRVGAIMAQLCPGFRLTYALATTSKFELPADKVSLEQIFLRMLTARDQGMICSWGVSSMTLEDVFLHICNAQG